MSPPNLDPSPTDGHIVVVVDSNRQRSNHHVGAVATKEHPVVVVDNNRERSHHHVGAVATKDHPSEAPLFLQARLSHTAQEISVIDNHYKEECELKSEAKTKEDDWLDNVMLELYKRPSQEVRLRRALEQDLLDRRDEDSPRSFLLISGPVGSARSIFARSVVQPMVDKLGGYFVCGKFEKHTQSTPYAAFVMAINEFINLVVQNGEEEMKLFANGIHEYVGASGISTLRRWIPNMSKVLGSPTETESAAANAGSVDRLAVALDNMRRALDATGRPIYFLMEDLQFADKSSLEKFAGKLRKPKDCTGMIMVTCDNSISPQSEVATKFREAEDLAGVKISNIALDVLGEDQIRSAFTSNLSMDPVNAARLASRILEKTLGDYFLAAFLIQWINKNSLLEQDPLTGKYFFDEEEFLLQIGQATSGDILMRELEALPSDAQEVLKVSSCLGFLVNCDVVSLVLGREINSCLSDLCERGLLVWCPRSEAFCFADDRVQEAAHDLIPEQERALFHLEIGRRLWRRVNAEQLDLFIFLIVHQLQRGKDLIKREKERRAVAELCLHAGQKAAGSSSFDKARSVFEFGLSFLDDSYWRTEYDLMLSLCSSSVEMEMYAANFEKMDRLIDDTVNHARTVHDSLRVYACRVNALGVRGCHKECVETGHDVLKLIGHGIPYSFCKLHALKHFKRVRKLLRGKSDDQLLRLPRMRDKTTLEAMRIMSLMSFPAMSIKSITGPQILLRLMHLTLTDGHSVFSGIAFISYAIFCSSGCGTLDEALRFGRLALELQERENRVDYLPRVYLSYYGFIHGWRKPLKEGLGPLLQAHLIGLQTGDIESANVSFFMYCMSAIEAGVNLEGVHKNMESGRELIASKRQRPLLLMTAPFFAYIEKMIGLKSDEELTSEEFEKQVEEVGLEKVKVVGAIWKMRLYNAFDEVEKAGRVLEQTDFGVLMAAPQFAVIGLTNLCATVAVANLRKGRNVKFHKKVFLATMKKFRRWARSCPHECSSKLALIEAEWASLHKKNDVARERYTNAILISKGMENKFELAMSHERAMSHYLEINDVDEAKYHGAQAYDAYVCWGAFGKAEHLKNRLDSLFDQNWTQNPSQRSACPLQNC